MSLAMKARQKVKRKAAAKDRVFGCDLVEHLQSSGHDVPQVLKSCTEFVEHHGIVDGIYRLSGVSSNIQKLRSEFDTERTPDLNKDVYLQDIHCVSSLCKAYFRELPNPLLTYQLYDKFADAVAIQLEEGRLEKIKEVLKELPPPHHRTLEFLTKHLVHMASFSPQTNMHVRNLAIVWAPNLLRSKDIEMSGLNGTSAFMEVRIQSIVVEFILNHVEQIFGDAPLRGGTRESLRKSLLLIGSNLPTMLNQGDGPPQMRPYHTIIDLNDSKRKGSLKGKKWKSIFNLGRSSQDAKRKFVKTEDKDYKSGKLRLRPAKSMDSLSSVPCAGDDETDLGRKKSQKKLLTLGRESFDGPASLDITFLASGECPEKAKVEVAVAGKLEEGESATAKSEPTTPKANRSGALSGSSGSPHQGRSPKSGRNRAEKCLGIHITGPLSVTVPFHITSNLTLSRLTRGLECPALSHCAATEEEEEGSSKGGSSKDTQDGMTVAAAAADEDAPATEATMGDSEENRMSMEVQDSFSFLDSQEAWMEEAHLSPFGGPVNTAGHGLDLGPLVEDDMGTGIMNQIIGGGMQLEMFSSLPPLNYLSIEECMNEHSDEDDDQYYLATACPDGKDADPEEVYLSAFDDLSPLANEAKKSDERREEEDRSTNITRGSPLEDLTHLHFFGSKTLSQDLPDYRRHPESTDRIGKESAVLPTSCLESTNPTRKESSTFSTCLPEATDRTRKQSAGLVMCPPESTDPTGKESAVVSMSHPELIDPIGKESAVFSMCHLESTNPTRKESSVFSTSLPESTDRIGKESAGLVMCLPESTDPTGKESAVVLMSHPELIDPTRKESAVFPMCRLESTNLTKKESSVFSTCLPESTDRTGKESAIVSMSRPESTNPTRKESSVFPTRLPESTDLTGKKSSVFSMCRTKSTDRTGKEPAVYPNLDCPFHESKLEKERFVLEARNGNNLETTEQALRKYLSKPTGLEMASPSLEVEWKLRSQHEQKMDLSFPELTKLSLYEMDLLQIEDLDPSLEEHLSTFDSHQSSLLGQSSEDDSSAPDVCLHGGSVEPDVTLLEDLLPKAFETELPDGSVHMRLTSSTVRVQQVKSFPVIPPKPQFARIPSSTPKIPAENGSGQFQKQRNSMPGSLEKYGGGEAEIRKRNDTELSLEKYDLLGKVYAGEDLHPTKSLIAEGLEHDGGQRRTSEPSPNPREGLSSALKHHGTTHPSRNPTEGQWRADGTTDPSQNPTEGQWRSYGITDPSQNPTEGQWRSYGITDPSQNPIEGQWRSYGITDPSQNPIEGQWRSYGITDPSQNPTEGQWRADGTTDPSRNPIEGLSSAWKHHGTTDPSRNPIEGQRRADGITDPSQNPIEGQQRADRITDLSRNPIEGLSSALKHHGTTDPSQNPIESQQRADGTTKPSPNPIEGLSSALKHHGTMDPSQNPIEGQQRAGRTTDPSLNPIEGPRSALKHHGTTDPSRNPTEGQQRADGTTDPSPKPREGFNSAWKHHGTMDPSRNPTEGQQRADGTTDPSPKPREGLSSAWKHHGTMDPSRNPTEGQQRADGTTDPSSKPREGLNSAWKHHGTTDSSRNPTEGQQRADGTTDPSPKPREGLSSAWKHHGTMDPSRNPTEGQQRADGTTDPSSKPREGLNSAWKHHGTTDSSRNPTEGQQRADGTTDPSPKPREGLSSAWKHHGTMDPSPNPTEAQRRAEANPPRRAQWRNNGGSMSFDEAVALARERQGGHAAMRRVKTSCCAEDGAEKKAGGTTTLQRKPALKLSRPQSCAGPADGHLGVKPASLEGQVAFDPEGGPPKGRRSSAKGRRLSLSEEAL